MDDFSSSPLRGASVPRSDGAAQAEPPQQKTPLDDFRTWRYAVLRTISVPVPCLTSKVPLIGGRSAAELLVMGLAALILIVLIFSQSTFLDICIAICVILGLRNNILDLFFGVSFERAIYFHRFFGTIACILLWLHAILKSFDSLSGIGLLITVFLTSLLYLIKPYAFELFYYLHIMLYCSIIPLVIIHGAQFAAFASIAWALDLIVRYLITGKSVEAEIVPLSDGITQIRFKKNFSYSTGQFCFVRIPEIGFMEYHPFSLATAPQEEVTAFAVRASGDWTQRLCHLATSGPKKSLSIQIEGPYGRPSIDLDSGLYKVIGSEWLGYLMVTHVALIRL
jgi:predicted ferric reductase